MSRLPAYEREPYRSELATEITAVGEEDGRPFALLADTVLYPEGGGQPADRGRLEAGDESAEVVDVQKMEGAIHHLLDRPLAPGPVVVRLDWARRFDHMQQHTAQHLLTAVAAARHGWQTTSFHLGVEICDIELDAAQIPDADLGTLEEAVVAEIRAGRRVSARRVAPEDLPDLPVRSRGLPAGHRGRVRLVEIEGLDLNTCGGIHLRSTGEIETIKLLGSEPLRGGTRLHWIAGTRVRHRLGGREELLAALRGVLGAGDDELAAVARLKLDQLKESERGRRWLAGRLAEATARSLAARPGLLVTEHFDDGGAALLQQVARHFSASEHPGMALLTAESPEGAFFAVAAGSACPLAVTEVGRRVAEALGGRGGGSGPVFQGKAGSLARRQQALAALLSLLEPSHGSDESG